jgi:putative SOS response-associated peptidase YedK
VPADDGRPATQSAAALLDVVTANDDRRELVTMRWGLVTWWWSKPLKELRMATFNARAETVETKPVFRDAFKRSRCLIPMSGYYEWQDTPNGKQPWYFTARDGSPLLTAAGLWGEWKNRESGERIQVLHDDCHHAQQLRCGNSRSHASVLDGGAIRAMAERGGGAWDPKASFE